MLEPIKAHAATTETRMSGMGNKADKICSRRAFLFLTHKRHRGGEPLAWHKVMT
jgi:hypothetical protein